MRDYIVHVCTVRVYLSPSRCIQSLISGWSHRAAEVDASFHTSPLMQVGTTESCDSSSIDVSCTESNNYINKRHQYISIKFTLLKIFLRAFEISNVLRGMTSN